jgi:hypothetical protein
VALALRDIYKCGARSKDAEQWPEAQDGTYEYAGAYHGERQLARRIINTSHKQSFR